MKKSKKIEDIWIIRGPHRSWIVAVKTKEKGYKKQFHYKKDAKQWMADVINNPALISRMELFAEYY